MILNIRGLIWSVEIMPLKKLKKLYGKDSIAITLPDTRSIYLTPESSDETIRHELIHAYLAENNLNSCHDISLKDFEEIVAETISNHWHQIESHFFDIHMAFYKDRMTRK